jgi:hypothetical protein
VKYWFDPSVISLVLKLVVENPNTPVELLYVRTLPETDNDARAEEVPKFETIPSEDVDTSPVRPPIEVTPMLLRVFPDQESPVPAEIRFDGVDQNSERFVVEDVSVFVIAVSAEVDAFKVDTLELSDEIEPIVLAHSVVDAVRGIVYPDATENAPVELLYERLPNALNTLRTEDVEKEEIPVRLDPSP